MAQKPPAEPENIDDTEPEDTGPEDTELGNADDAGREGAGDARFEDSEDEDSEETQADAGPTPEPARRVSARTGWVVAAFLLFWPLAVPALVQAVRAARDAAADRLDAARTASRRALGFAVAAICTGTLLLAGSAVAVVMAPAWLPAGAAGYIPPVLAEAAGIAPTAPEDPGEEASGSPAYSGPADGIPTDGATDPFGVLPTPGSTEGEDIAEWWATEGQEATEDPSRTRPVDLESGDCLDTEEVDGVSVLYWIPVVPCDEPHHGEVFGVTRLDDSVAAEGRAPTQSQLWEAADAYCYPEFDEFVGEAWAVSELTYWPVAPSQESWEEGDRKVACIIESEEPVTGTLEGAGR
ncbi:septum formation family protein [Myceligenerans pegani]|uniref:Septum formation family protein n=1 Tax=Myceligenerans pegani TaxID=2776917 RepID=A0ABR9MV14_9MICO|nr:septum formation family protein [Myceligenerans sp. TRM 65318]MBE1874764.1 septum formation family protein [Myceligenerans sp. TRM 65318]MBE3017035.1 septum formation family protein [Myceligenerans sp. TRM 65318]